MSLYPLLLLPVVAAVLGALVLLLRRGAAARLTVPSWLAYGIAGTILAVGLVYALVLGFTPPWPPAPTNVVTPPEFMMPGGFRPPPGSYPDGPLAAGERMPPLEARGWRNGEPPVPGADGAKVIVLDLWAHW